MELDINSMPHMYHWVHDFEHPYTAMSAGVGSGKTRALQEKMLLAATLNPGCLGICVSPTFKMLQKNILNERNGLPVLLREQGVPFDFVQGNEFVLHLPNGVKSYIECTHPGGSTSGRTAAWFAIDEADLMKPTDADDMWNILIARLRDPNMQVKAGFVSSTPEGRKWMWQRFVQDLQDRPELQETFKLYQASTYQNWFLPKSFIRDLESQYDAKRVRAHLYGEFVSLTEGQVYYDFDRHQNDVSLEHRGIRAGELILAGVDFNKNGMSCPLFVERRLTEKGPLKLLGLDEVMGSTNTPALIIALKERYPEHQFMFYPDATGKDIRSTVDHESDHNLLRKAFGQNCIVTTQANPRILNRVGSVNGSINANGVRRLLIDHRKCKLTTLALELHTFGPDGLPTKGIFLPKTTVHQDGPNDALGYLIDRKYPIRRPTAPVIRLTGT